MPGRLRNFTRRFFIISNIIIAVFYLFACLSPYVNPSEWWIMAFLAIGFPILMAFLIFFILFWLFIKPKRAILSVIVLLIGWKNISNVFGFHFGNAYSSLQKKEDKALRIMTWNVRRFIPLNKNQLEDLKNIDQHIEVIRKYDPDVICIQEYCTSKLKGYIDADTIFKSQLGYPYAYFSRDYLWWVNNGLILGGTAIFSKYPLQNAGMIRFPNSGRNAESLTYADVIRGKDTVRIINMHLQSFSFTPRDYKGFDKIRSRSDTNFAATRSIFKKMKIAFMLRSEQADEIKRFADSSNVAEVLCGDFNDVPNSYTYHNLLGDRNDAFLEKGFGFGRTYTGFFPTLRIDFFLTDPKLAVLQFKKSERKLSDHYPLIVDIKLKD